MKTLSHRVHPRIPTTAWPAVGNYPAVFFDIETTGFHRSYCHLVLVGVMALKDGQWMRTQWFAQTPEDEKALLEAFLDTLPSPALLISFNGERFDLPFLAARMAHWGIASDAKSAADMLLKDKLHLDLLTIAKVLPTQLASRRLKAIEAFLGIQRTDTISGGDSVALYRQYQRQPDEHLLEAMLLHNADDIDNMLPLWRLFDYLDVTEVSRKPQLTGSGILFHYRIDNFLTIEGISPVKGAYFWQNAGHSFHIDGHRVSIRLQLTTFEDTESTYLLVPYPELPISLQGMPQSTWLIGINGQLQNSAVSTIVDAFLNAVLNISEM